MLPRDPERRRQLRFLLAGGWNTLFGYLAFLAAHAWLGDRAAGLAALVAAYLVALPHAYVVQRLFVFQSREAWRSQFARFAIANTAVFLANALVLPLAVRIFGWDARVAQALFVSISTVASYLVHKHFSFKQASPIR